MTIEYDEEIDGAYIWFVEDLSQAKQRFESEIWPAEFNEELGFLLDKNGKIIGIEVLPASKYLDAHLLLSSENRIP